MEKYDLQKNIAILCLVGIIGVWAGYSAYDELGFPYEDCKSFGKRSDMGIGICTDYGVRLYYMYQYEENYRGDNPLRAVTLELLYYSDKIFGDYRIVPFISSGFVLALSYFLAVRLTGKNYAGLVTVLFVLHSPIFYKYDLVMTYPNFWVVFLLGGFYFMYKSFPLSVTSYFLGVPAKIINILNFPAMLVFAFLSDIKNKRRIIVTYLAVFGGIIGIGFSTKFLYPPVWHRVYVFFLSQFEFQPMEFLWWLGMWSIELFTDKITLFMIFLLIPCLFMLKREKVTNASAVLAMIFVFILQPAFISGFTKFTNEDYRYLHLVIFVGIGLSMILPNLRVLGESFQRYFNVKSSANS